MLEYEVEQKFVVLDEKALADELAKCGATILEPITQTDQYFSHPSRDFARTDEALRIRRVGASNFVTYKGPKIDAETKTRREIELPFESGERGAEQLTELFHRLGFTAVAQVHKVRTPLTIPWQGWQVRGALDEVTGLGRFVELELVVTSSQIEAAQHAVVGLSESIKLGRCERRSYLQMLLAQ